MAGSISTLSNGIMSQMPRSIYSDSTRMSGQRKPPEMRKNFQLAEIHEIHHEIARQLVIGCKPKEVAKNLNTSYQNVINVKNSPIVQEQMKLLGATRNKETMGITKQIRELRPKCIAVLTDILDDDDLGKALKLKTSLAILDRAGHAIPKNVNVQSVHAIVSPQDLALIKQRALEIGIETADEVIDV